MKYTYIFTLIMALNFPFNAFSFQAEVTQHNVCNFRAEYRSVRIQVETADKFCETIYTKIGQDSRSGGGQFITSCERVFNNIVGNLTKAGWECKNAFGSKFTIEKKEG